jgi:glycine hydroxymethyltransferase
MLANAHPGDVLSDIHKQAHEVTGPMRPRPLTSDDYHDGLLGALAHCDEEVYHLIGREYDRQRTTLQLIAAESHCSRAVLAALGSVVQNKTTEGFAGARFHGGCQIVDSIETLAIDRAREAFKARYANVQPHSGTQANQILLMALLESGDRILSLSMDQGGHVSHGARVSFAGKFFQVEQYTVDRDTLLLDYDAIREQARRFQPKMIICGASAYSRTIDFAQFRDIADEVGAYLMADISHISGLVIAGVHPSPVDYAHFTTTSTYKPGGPRGGLIVMGRDFDMPVRVGQKAVPLSERIDKTTFPGFQGTPYLNNIAAKAVFFKETLSPEYRSRQFRIVENAKALAQHVRDLGYDILTGGTDNHLFLANVAHFRPGMTGLITQKCLEDCGIIVNMNWLPYDTQSPRITSGMRIGTPIVTRNGMGPDQMELVAHLVDSVLTRVEIRSETEYNLDDAFREDTAEQVRDLCSRFPMW